MKSAANSISRLTTEKQKSKVNRKKILLLSFAFLLLPSLAQAQSILPAIDSTGTVTIAQQNSPTNPSGSGELRNDLDQGNFDSAVTKIEQKWENEFEDYFGVNLSDVSMTADDVADTLAKIGRKTGKKSALIYAVPSPEQLELLLILPDGKPVRKSIPEANREALSEVIKEFNKEVKNPRKTNTTSYLKAAQQLYKWIMAPLEQDLASHSIETLLFCVGSGLRSIPLGALHDGQQFLVEKYSFSRIPAFKLTDTLYADVKNSEVLAMGASVFKKLSPLPAVPVELSSIMKDLWKGESFLNQTFTLDNLRSQLQKKDFGIVHLATHAEFKPGEPSNSFIQLWDTKLTLDRMNQLGLNDPPVNLLVLSACKTAVGDKQVELGFAGLAVQSGVKSALASLWYVSDAGTLALMNEFYQQLKTAPIKAEALRQAQIAMIQGKVSLVDGQLRGSKRSFPLPPELNSSEKPNLSHPFFWAAFSMIGSPW